MSGESGDFEVEIYESYTESIDYTEQIVQVSNKLDYLNNTMMFISWFVVLIFLFNSIIHKRGCF